MYKMALDRLRKMSSAEDGQDNKRALTRGARLVILLQPFLRRSALTIPVILVPNISFLLFRRTTALSSNFTNRPSGLIVARRVRTTTARRTSPLFTFCVVPTAREAEAMGRDCFTTQTISSPTPAKPCPTLFLRTLTHSTRRAPVLSMHYSDIKFDFKE